MFLAWISRLLASLLVSVLFMAVLSFVLVQTVFSPPYLRHELQVTGAYSQLTAAINQQIAQGNQDGDITVPGGTAASQAYAAQLQQILTPQLIQQKLDGVITQTQAYYNDKGPLPSLDISTEATQLQAAGVQLPQGTDYTQPIQLKPLSKLHGTKKLVDNSVWSGIGTIVLLVAGIIAIAVKRKRYKPLANIFISLGLLVGLSGITLLLAHRLTDQFINVNGGGTDKLAALVRALIDNITHDIGLRLAIIALVSLAVGVAGRILLRQLTKQPKLAAVPPEQPALAAPELPAPEEAKQDDTSGQTN